MWRPQSFQPYSSSSYHLATHGQRPHSVPAPSADASSNGRSVTLGYPIPDDIRLRPRHDIPLPPLCPPPKTPGCTTISISSTLLTPDPQRPGRSMRQPDMPRIREEPSRSSGDWKVSSHPCPPPLASACPRSLKLIILAIPHTSRLWTPSLSSHLGESRTKRRSLTHPRHTATSPTPRPALSPQHLSAQHLSPQHLSPQLRGPPSLPNTPGPGLRDLRPRV